MRYVLFRSHLAYRQSKPTKSAITLMADYQIRLVDMDDIQAHYVRQHSHGGSHVKGSNKESVSLFSLPVASVCVPVVPSS